MAERIRALAYNVYLLKRVMWVQSSSMGDGFTKNNEMIHTMGVDFSLGESSQQKMKSRVPQNYGVVQTIHIIEFVVLRGIQKYQMLACLNEN